MENSSILFTLICAASMLNFAARASLDESLLLYAPFDGNVDAAVTRGEATGTAAVTPAFRPGLRGQALVIGGVPEDAGRIRDDLPAHAAEVGRNVYFDSDKNIDVTQGTLSFWLKPLDWSGGGGGFNVLFRTQVGREHFMLYRHFHSQCLRLIIGSDRSRTIDRTNTRIGHWQPGAWRHLAVTWSPYELKLFVDGQLTHVARRRHPLQGAEPVEPLSIGPGGTWAKGFVGHSLIDEFRIHDRPLSHAEIVSLYRLDADAALLDSDQVTLGRRTPTLDGRIEPFEYAFSGTGFSDLRGFAAPCRSHYALSYDDENLYVAVRSAASGQWPVASDQWSVISGQLGIENHKSTIDNRQSKFS